MSDQPGDGGTLAGMEAACRGARLWGLELDPRYRVFAATLELAPEADPWDLDVDRRVQLLCSPVSTILGALRRRTRPAVVDEEDEEGRTAGNGAGDAAGAGNGDDLQPISFDVDQLVGVSATFGGALLEPPVFGRPEPRPGQWGPVFGLQGRSSAPDGRRHTATLSVEDDEARLDVFIRFDEIEVRDADGNELPLTR